MGIPVDRPMITCIGPLPAPHAMTSVTTKLEKSQPSNGAVRARLRAAGQFGLTPAARARIAAGVGPQPEPLSKFDGADPTSHRPRRRAAEERDEVAAPHSITSSARSMIDGGVWHGRAPWRSCGSRPSEILLTAPGDRPACRRVECDPHRWRRDDRGLPGRVRRRATRRTWERMIAHRPPVRCSGPLPK
jgi:hypothetical protein